MSDDNVVPFKRPGTTDPDPFTPSLELAMRLEAHGLEMAVRKAFDVLFANGRQPDEVANMVVEQVCREAAKRGYNRADVLSGEQLYTECVRAGFEGDAQAWG
jgi:hypothetical protein